MTNMIRGVRRSLLGGSSGFNPASVSGYGWGVWPYESFRRGLTYQDIGKTTPAVGGDPVRVITDPYRNIDVIFGATTGRPVLTVSGTQAYLTLVRASSQTGVSGTPLVVGTAVSAFAALNFVSSPGANAAVGGGNAASGQPLWFWRSGGGNDMGLNNDFVAALGDSTAALTTATWYDLGVTYASPNVAFRKGGAADGTASTATTFTASMDRIGSNTGASFLDALVAGFCCFSTQVTGGDLAAVEAHLATLHP